MVDLDTLFDKRLFKAENFLKQGFERNDTGYFCRRSLPINPFAVDIFVAEDGNVKADVIDLDTEEVYTLVKAPEASGEFIGQLRTAFEDVLRDVAEKCGYGGVFRHPQTKEILAYIRERYGDEPEFLWEKFPLAAAVRRKDNAKWYAVLLAVRQDRIGLSGKDMVEIIDLRAQPEEINQLVDGKKYFAGYHMNKKHWMTICLDGSVSASEICLRIDSSYNLAQKSVKGK